MTGAEEENPSGPDDPTHRRSNASDHPMPATSVARKPNGYKGHRVTGQSDATWSDDPTPYAEKGVMALNG